MAGRRRQRPGAGKAGAGRPARPAPTPRQPPTPRPPFTPRQPPSRGRVRLAALVFAGLAVVLGILGLTVNGGYLRPAVLLLILAVLWGVRALTMR
jgi:hypothetical protein